MTATGSGGPSAGAGGPDEDRLPERPTLDTVARAAGVSRMTVSNAYNRPDQLSAATRERVLAVAEQLGYAGPDPAGRSLRRGRAGTIGVILTESLSYAFTDPGLVSFLLGVADEMSAAGQALLLVPADADDDGALVRNAIVDGFILCSIHDDDPAVAAVRSRRLPYVASGSPRHPPAPYVGIDNRRAAGLAAQHLVDLGHRRIGVVGLPPDMPVEPSARVVRTRQGFAERVTGFADVVSAADGGPGVVTVELAASNSVDAGAAAAAALLASRPRPTAVFAVSDVLALGVLRAAAESGVAVPQQLSVVGFDDIAEAARARPPLTTVAQDLREQGRRAARMTLDLVEGRTVRSSGRTPHLVVRESTARAPRRRGAAAAPPP
ncbi:MAG: substrate-binding domain-containing protein [Frankiales bacterium]|nr:substrate-binding domain-containing protein [Frankiales bacterium]